MAEQLSGVERIQRERLRQIGEEGFSAEHDRTHFDGELAMAAVCYATPPDRRNVISGYPAGWPWLRTTWNPSPDDRVRELTKAGALVAAEIDRLLAWQARLAQVEEATP